jgi:hypothetical protein
MTPFLEVFHPFEVKKRGTGEIMSQKWKAPEESRSLGLKKDDLCLNTEVQIEAIPPTS